MTSPWGIGPTAGAPSPARRLYSAPTQSYIRAIVAGLMRSERGYTPCRTCGAPGPFAPTWRPGAYTCDRPNRINTAWRNA